MEKQKTYKSQHKKNRTEILTLPNFQTYQRATMSAEDTWITKTVENRPTQPPDF